LKNWRGHWIVISINFEKLDLSEGCQLLKHTAGHMNQSQQGTYTLFFRPKNDIRRKLYEASKKAPADAIALAGKTDD